LSLIGAHETVLTQGFIARTPAGETCLLGRGGSDTSAALFAALLGADELEIWTDVPGMFTADPRRVPVARLIRRMGYREAQELAALGAKVLHPRCLAPLRARSIPLSIHSTEDPAAEGTRVEATEEDHPTVTAVTCRNGVTLLSIASDEMWGEAGFMARVFAPFAEFGVSVDLVATSQYAITLTLDDPPGGADGPIVSRLVERLAGCGRVEVVHPCAVVSIVGRRIRAALHELGPAMAVLKERPVHLVSDSAEDLNLSFVVDQADANTLVTRLHRQLFGAQGGGPRFGPTWEMLRRDAGAHRAPPRWWAAERERLLALSRDGRARYVYHLPTIRARVRHLVERLASIDRVYYSMKANAHERVLETVAAAGCGIECVSAPELCHARRVLGPQVALLFTPNFCPLDEFELAFATGAEVVVDGPETLVAAPASFGGREIGLRIDPGRGLGHHEKVRTAGSGVKFGHPIDDVERLRVAVERCGAKVVGLHAHVGSGIFDPVAWSTTGRALARLVPAFPELRWIDLGGGLGVPENPGQPPLDLDEVERHLAGLAADLPQVELRLEPGRFLVSEAGVLLLPVTQTRQKGGINFAGVSTGMNSLIRPALYGAWHPLHNLSRLDQPAREYWHVVGPICETSDVLGRDRPLPATEPGDLLLAENAGAYGAVMASHYNLRPPAEESVIDDA
ncbi:MAG TPA: bifunctional aspartate kinase/diaminopimelate decarboxylase, partial [Candidatus Polarisedimenticolaceae bacterium]|nr:bifunctional aspartate kinase/diaminopimelate decarboxylase [Candidatus Polarisedimenticolaceae bacterium]